MMLWLPIFFCILINLNAGADPGFLEKGFVCIKVWGFDLLF